MTSSSTIEARWSLMVALGSLALLAADARPASAQVMGGSGAACNGGQITPLPGVIHNFGPGGAVVVGDSFAHVACGAVRLTTSSPRNIYVDIYDGSNAKSVTCDLVVRSWDGFTTRFSSSQSTTAAFFGSTFLTATIPTSVTGYVTVDCNLPGVGSAGYSRLAGFSLQ